MKEIVIDKMTIQLPEGYYFETSNDKRVVSINIEKEKGLSVGDYVKDIVTGDTFIVNKINDYFYYSKFSIDFNGAFNETFNSFSVDRAFYHLNDEEKKKFDNKMRYAVGLEYNATENKYVRCRAKRYYFINSDGCIIGTDDMNVEIDNNRYNLGNYFISKEQAESYLEKLKSIFKRDE